MSKFVVKRKGRGLVVKQPEVLGKGEIGPWSNGSFSY